MKDKTKIIKVEENQDMNEGIATNETDDINMYIRKVQLQNLVLKKLTENLSKSADKDCQAIKSKS